MNNIIRFESVKDYNALSNHETLHPLVSVIDFSKSKPWVWPGGESIKVSYGMYSVFLKEVKRNVSEIICDFAVKLLNANKNKIMVDLGVSILLNYTCS